MRHAAVLIAAMTIVLLAAPANAKSRQFFCGDGSTVSVTVLNDQTIRATPIEGRTMTLRQTPAQKWYFIKGDYGIRISADQARLELEIPDFGVKNCVYQAANVTPSASKALPHAAQSWGGKLRAGPGQNYEAISTLSEGDRITVLERADAPLFQNRPWFKIPARGPPGYHWGGIICPLDVAIPGTYKVCHAGAAKTRPATKPKKAAKKVKRTQSQRCRDNRAGCSAGVKEACRNLARWGC